MPLVTISHNTNINIAGVFFVGGVMFLVFHGQKNKEKNFSFWLGNLQLDVQLRYS